jgi:adenine-specific DNA-methyltransferase
MNSIKKFKELLGDVFQFEGSDLDFGIYRILNYKRDEVEKFIDQKLPQIIEDAFQKHKENLSEDIQEEYERVKRKVIEDLGEDAITPTGELNPDYAKFPIGKRYLEIKEQKELLEKLEEIKEQVYNDLYSFFLRFYEDGDFIPQYRYSKEPKYSIPYNGEEVKLYWANVDQYYIKTGILFRDYTFRAGDKKVIFRTVSAREEINGNKATKQRYFVLDEEPVQIDQEGIIIRFQYRELGQQEINLYKDNGNGQETEQEEENGGRGRGIKQEKINGKIFEGLKKELMEISSKIKELQYTIESLLKEQRNQQPLLLYHINRFTAKNTRDYFIQKSLKKFLMGQLDYFIKSEVLNYETLSEEKYLDKHITRAKVVKEVGEKIIDFLAQIEDFQKKLWEKKKFVIQTHYVITLDRIKKWAGEEFYREVLKKVLQNKEQLEEWERLGFGQFEREEDLEGRRLPIDTRYFDESFKWELLERISGKVNLDDTLDGLLIKSENWQALNTILNKYREKIKTIYIDPPYNTGNDEFLYRDRYQHSSWLTMMENRLSLAKKLLRDDGVIFVSIGNNANVYKESYKLGLLMDSLFEKRFADLIWKRRSASGSYVITDITEIHEYILCYGKNNSYILMNILSPQKLKEYTNRDDKGIFKWHDLVIHQYTKEQRPNLFYGVVYNFVKGELDFEKNEEQINDKEEVVIYPSNDGRSVFAMTKESMKEVYKRGVIGVIKEGNSYKIKIKKYLYDESGVIIGDPLKSILDDNEIPWEIKGTAQATKELKELLGISFNTAKPTNLIKLLVYVSSLKNDTILDFFAGSGTTAHAVMKLNKEDGGNRKFILVEMADYFETIILPRIKKVAYSFNWEDGKPQNTDGLGVFFKYQIVEQYEDTLDNLELNESEPHKDFFKDDYLIKYFLELETKDDPHLLNISMLKDPYNYKLKVNLSEVGEPKEMAIDVIETFNYLLGLKINKLMRNEREGNIYTFVLGERDGKSVAVVWRVYSEGWAEEDYKKDRDFIEEVLKEFNPEIIYINGQHALVFESFKPDVRNVEPEFKRRMFSHEY